jgi:protein-L-isoaspartate O-methyltransferase
MEDLPAVDVSISEITKHWNWFAKLPDSSCIASLAALKATYGMMLLHPPVKILEIGTGIGAFSAFLLKFTSAEVVSTELVKKFELCAMTNLEEYFIYDWPRITTRLRIFRSEVEVELSKLQGFDYLIIDGAIRPSKLENLIKDTSMKIIIVENQRLASRLRLAGILLKHRVRFKYLEMDSDQETGIAVFYLDKRLSKSSILGVIDFCAFVITVGPRFIRSFVTSKGGIRKINRAANE